MVTCRVEVQGDPEAPETGVTVEVEVGSPVGLRAVREAFPFVGVFHFRQKVTLPGSKQYVWLDLTDEGETLSGTNVELRVRGDRACPTSFQVWDVHLSVKVPPPPLFFTRYLPAPPSRAAALCPRRFRSPSVTRT